MRPGNVSVRGQIGVHERQHRRTARSVAPVAHQVHDHAKHAHQDDARVFHPTVRVRSELFREGAAGFRVGEDGVAFSTKGER